MQCEADIFSQLPSIAEVSVSSIEEARSFMEIKQPYVFRNLVTDWPLVSAGCESGKAARSYLLSKSRDIPFVTTVAPADAGGRIFYGSDMSMNATTGKAPLKEVFERIDLYEDQEKQPIIYLSLIHI